MGPINVPPVPTFPKELTATEKTITRCQRIYAGSTNGGFCAVDNNGVTHCKIKDIDLRKGFLRVDSEAGPIRLYISGDVSAGGKAGIIHSSGSNDNPDPARLSLFGKPRDNSIETHQTVMLSGASKPAKAANLFAFSQMAPLASMVEHKAQLFAMKKQANVAGGMFMDLSGPKNGMAQTPITLNSLYPPTWAISSIHISAKISRLASVTMLPSATTAGPIASTTKK